MRKLVSIAIATYNGEKFLREQLSSIFNQTYKNIEVVVCDDKSNDSTIDILEEFSQSHGLEYHINKKRLGVAKNFQKVISKCNGDFIALSDQDDIWMENKIYDMISNINNNSLIYSDGIFVNENGETKNEKISKFWNLYGKDSKDKYFYRMLVLNSMILGSSCMFSSCLKKEILPIHKSSRNHDWWISLMAHLKGGVKYYNKILYKYRIHEQNESAINASNKNLIKRIFEYKEFKKNKREEMKIVNFLLENNLYDGIKNKKFITNILNESNTFFSHKKYITIIKNMKYRNQYKQPNKILYFIRIIKRIILS